MFITFNRILLLLNSSGVWWHFQQYMASTVNVRHRCHPLRIKAWGLLSTLVTSGWYSTDEQGDPSFRSKRYQFLHWHRLQEQNTMLEQGVQHYRKKWMMRLYSAEHSKRVHDVLASLHYKSLSKKKKWNFVFHLSCLRCSFIIESGVIGKLVYFLFWQCPI